MEYEYHPAVAEMARQIVYSVPIPFDLPEDDRLLFLQAEFNPATLACQFVWTVHDETNQFLIYDTKGWRVASLGMTPRLLAESMAKAAGELAINPEHRGFGVLVDWAAMSLSH